MSLSKPVFADGEYVPPDLSGKDAETAMHVYKLSLFCRLCNEPKAIPADPYRKTFAAKSFESTIAEMWPDEIFISKDDPRIHPPYICEACHKKILR